MLGGTFDPANYVSERMMVEARDGVKVPVSIVYRKGLERNGQNPFLLYAYGSYGYSMDASFSVARLSMLDRGFVYAIAHSRWKRDGATLVRGRQAVQQNEHVQRLHRLRQGDGSGLHQPRPHVRHGWSAGGLLMGAVMNLEPSLFNGVIAAVPFVDVINTMLDETIPLTTFEFDGATPKTRPTSTTSAVQPLRQRRGEDYPHTLITTGYRRLLRT